MTDVAAAFSLMPETMLTISEAEAASLVSMDDAISAVGEALVALDRGEARAFPVVRETIPAAGAVFGVKSAVDLSAGTLGLKAGGYWPGNQYRGRSNHQSTTLLFDIGSGAPTAIVGANYLTAVRTAAASALSVRYLAREDAKVLGIVGAGHQSRYQLRAMAGLRAWTRVLIWNRTFKPDSGLLQEAATLGLQPALVGLEELVAAADVLVTATSASEPLIRAGWLRPGTHIAAIGADTKGKQELDAELVAAAAVFADSVDQALTIGECQHAFAAGRLRRDDIRGTLGGLVAGRIRGRSDDQEITLFDSTGIALQDLAVAALACRRKLSLADAAPSVGRRDQP